MENDGSFGFESASIRFDNLFGSSWLNIKGGKFELDNIISEKRILGLSNNGGSYQMYHFQPVGESADQFTFGLGDNQLGVELSGHSKIPAQEPPMVLVRNLSTAWDSTGCGM